jgi:1-deoxy-D-xylulose-5-phosphate reductoisomerase
MNKGLELIEARWLFGVELGRIEVLIHREAVVHALVEWRDGSLAAQLSVPDMRLPIQMALAWPERLPAVVERLDLAQLGALSFRRVDAARFPCFALARAAGAAGGLAPAVLNAADEVAVELFHAGRISLGDLPGLVAAVLEAHPGGAAESLEAIEEADRWARAETARRAARGSLAR